MSDSGKAIDVGEVIRKSTSEASLDDLQRKGFKRVKVLDKAAIDRLIEAVVDKVVSERMAETDEAETQKLVEQARHEFDDKLSDLRKNEVEIRNQLKSEIDAREHKISELKARCQEFEAQIERAKSAEITSEAIDAREKALGHREQAVADREAEVANKLATFDARQNELSESERVLERRTQEVRSERDEIERERNSIKSERDKFQSEREQIMEKLDGVRVRELEIERRESELATQASARNDEILDLKETIQGLADSVRRAAGSGGGGNFSIADTSDEAIEALLSRADASADQVENNLGSVKVKKSQSGGVAANLAKLKSLNNGDE